MNLSEAKTLVELLHPGFREIAKTAMERVSESVADALAESNRKTREQIEELSARIERLEKNG
jgi:polyhydroxyalkanoate synthesis regulator phasin